MFNAVRYMVLQGVPGACSPNDFPPLVDGASTGAALDWGRLLRSDGSRSAQAFALAGRQARVAFGVILYGRTLQSTPESGARASYDRYKRKKGTKVHSAVDTLGHLLAVKVTTANEQERAQVADLARDVQKATGEKSEVAYADQGYTGEEPAAQAAR